MQAARNCLVLLYNFMPKISQLDMASAVTADDLLVVVGSSGGVSNTRRATGQQLLEFVDSGLGLVAGFSGTLGDALAGKADLVHGHDAGDLSGTLSSDRLPLSGVTAGTYLGSFTVDAYGRLTSANATPFGNATSGNQGKSVVVGTNGPLAVANRVASVNGKSGITITLVPGDIGAAEASHGHAGEEIDSGTVSVDRLPVTLERHVSVGSSGSAAALSLSSASVQSASLDASCVFTMPSLSAGASFTLFLTQTGSFTATFSGVRWMSGVAPTASSGAGKVDIFSFVSDGSYWYGTAAQGFV